MAIRFLQIEVTTRCNFSCWFCWGRHLEQQDIDFSVAEKALRTLTSVRHVIFQGTGESLLYPKWFEILTIAKELGMTIGMITNGSLLNKTNVDKILSLPFVGLLISIESTQPQQFESIRGGRFSKVLEGVKLLIDERNRRGLKIPTVAWAISVMRNTREELPKIIELGRQLGMDNLSTVQTLQRKPEYLDFYPPGKAEETLTQAEEDQVYAQARQLIAPEGQKTSVTIPPKRTRCNWLDHGIYLRANGKFTLCCHMKEDYVGDMANLKMDEILQVRESVHNELLNGRIPDVCKGCALANKMVKEHTESKKVG